MASLTCVYGVNLTDYCSYCYSSHRFLMSEHCCIDAVKDTDVVDDCLPCFACKRGVCWEHSVCQLLCSSVHPSVKFVYWVEACRPPVHRLAAPIFHFSLTKYSEEIPTALRSIRGTWKLVISASICESLLIFTRFYVISTSNNWRIIKSESKTDTDFVSFRWVF